MFRKLEEIEVWKRGCRHAVNICKLAESEPLARNYGLRDQIQRSAISIPSNIAEGYERHSRAEFKRFLYIAKGSCAELRTQLLIIQALDKFPSEVIKPLVSECVEIGAMLQSLADQIGSSKKES